MLSLGIGLTSVPVLARRGGYDPDALAFFARLTNQPTDARKKLYSDLIASLKTAGVWPKLDALYILAAADAQAARQNLVANAYNLTAVGSPSFTADRGYTGDGAAAYLGTGFVASVAGGKYALNSAHLGFWAATEALGNLTDAGDTTGAVLALDSRSAQGALRGKVNYVAADLFSTVASSIGHSILTRDTSTSTRGYRNGAGAGTAAWGSTAVPTTEITILKASNYTTRRLAAAHYGANLTAPDAAALYSALNTYLTAVGAA